MVIFSPCTGKKKPIRTSSGLAACKLDHQKMFATGCVWVELCGGYGGAPVCITKSENIGHIGSICPLIRLCIYPSVHPSICPSIHSSIHLSIYLSTYLSIYLPIYLSLYLSISVCEIPVGMPDGFCYSVPK